MILLPAFTLFLPKPICLHSGT
uniref:Uncharacterized protein n=1 Tax=Arundo donax TaxID=35708 RepID=A0A0A9DZ56_ARUDO